jgi:hypothetical protein
VTANFQIINNNSLNFQGRLIDLHNNFDLVNYDYDIASQEFKLTWKKSNGERVDKNELSGLTLTHKVVTYLSVSGKDEENTSYTDEACLGDITFFPSNARDINDSIAPQTNPLDNDDILYFFENGQLIRIHCEQIELTYQ